MRNPGRGISKRKLGGASVLSGVLNGVGAYVVNFLMPQPTTVVFRAGATANFTAFAAVRQNSELVFYVSSIVVGILIPLVIVGIAMLRSRGGQGGGEEVELQDSDLEK